MAKKKSTGKKPKKRSPGMIGGVHEGRMDSISKHITKVATSLTSLEEKKKLTKDKTLKGVYADQIKIRKRQLATLKKDLKNL